MAIPLFSTYFERYVPLLIVVNRLSFDKPILDLNETFFDMDNQMLF